MTDVFHDSAPVTVTSGRKLGDVYVVADKLSCSTRHAYRLADAGKMPAPLHLGALVRWDLDKIDEWIATGCPSVRTMKAGNGR
jgi:predicted DNA-binding transcriptional regulator AlpA